MITYPFYSPIFWFSSLCYPEALRKEGDDLRRVGTDIHERRLRAQEDLEQVQKTKEDCAAQLLLANEALVTAKKATEEAEKGALDSQKLVVKES